MIKGKKIIAVCIGRIQDADSNGVITALRDTIPTEKYSIFVYNTSSIVEDSDSEKNAQSYIYSFMDYDIIDAVIIVEETIGNSDLVTHLIDMSRTKNKPVVVVGEAHEGCCNIKFDYEGGFAEIVRHVIMEHNIKDLHFMAGNKGNPFSECRLETFKSVLQEYGIEFDESKVSYGDFWSGPAERETEKIVASGKLPEAIVCANDRMAITVCGVLDKHGIRVPEDVVVTGFDGVPEINYTSPRITSSFCDFKDLAKNVIAVVQALFDAGDKFPVSDTKTYLVKPRLLLAESCGCHGEAQASVSDYLNELNDQFYRYRYEEILLSRIVTRVQKSENLEQLAVNMEGNIFYDMFCLVEQECLDETINPMVWEQKERPLDREMILLYDSNAPKTFKPYSFPLNGIIPGLDYMLEHNHVLIFTALCYGDVPMGYMCFSFGGLNPGNYLKVAQTVNAMNNAIGGYRNIRHKQFLMSKIDKMARMDALTGLSNRHGFEVEYSQLLADKPEEMPFTIVLADLDGLKYINDTFGHKEGDVAIQTTAKALLKACPAGSLFTRFGGDEMLAVCREMQEPDSIRKAFYEYLAEYNKNSDKNYEVHASLGIYCTREGDGLEFEQIVEYADKLMYKDKITRKHRNGV